MTTFKLTGSHLFIGDVSQLGGNSGTQSITNAKGSVSGTVGGGPEISPDVWQLILGGIIFAGAVLLLIEAAKIQKWAFSKDDAAPSQAAGILLVVYATLLIGVLWLNYFLMTNPLVAPIPKSEIGQQLVRLVLQKPREAAMGLCLASILPAVLASHKFIVVACLSRIKGNDTLQSANSSISALVGVVFSFINLAGSLATLTVFITNWQLSKILFPSN